MPQDTVRTRQTGQRYHTLATSSLPARPPPAVVRISPRTRLESHAAPSAVKSKLPAGRKRAITMIGEGLSAPLLKSSDAADPVLLEMKKGVLLDVGNILHQFANLDRTIRDFCDACAEHIGTSKHLPRIGPYTTPASKGSPVAKPPSEFTSTEDYTFFTLLSIINTRIYDDIFRPFHPAAPPSDNDRLETEYLSKIDTSLQLAAASWRSKSFRSIDVMVTVPQQLQLFHGIISNVILELNSALERLPGPTTLPDSFQPQLEAILKTAYKWNRTVKMDVLKYDFEPFVVEPRSDWDPVQMESFERLRTTVRSDRKVISSVSLGLIGSVSLGGARVSHVQQKARVLVDEWFYHSSRGRTTSTSAAKQRPKPSTPTPSSSLALSNNSGSTLAKPPAAHISMQPRASGGMSMQPPPSSNQQQMPAKKQGGFLCC